MSARPDRSLRWAIGIVRCWRWLVPRRMREAWLREWAAELTALWQEGRGHESGAESSRHLVTRSLGAGIDAAAMRWHEDRPDLAMGSDLRHAWRGIARRPGSSLLVVLVLSIGIGSAATVGTATDHLLLAPLPYPDADRVVAIWDENPDLGIARSGPTPANMLDWRERSRAFTHVAAYYAGEPRTLDSSTGGAEKVAVAEVTADFFDVLAEPPLLGRVFSPEEVAVEDAVVVLGHGLWQRRFGGQHSVLDGEIRIDGLAHRIIGVMPASFSIPDDETALYLPWDFGRTFARLGRIPRDYRYLNVLARLAPGTTIDTAQQDMDRMSAALASEHAVNRGWRVRLTPLKEEIVGDLRTPLYALGGAVAFVLLIAAINAAYLILSRLATRRDELALRRALGASRFQVTRLLGFESWLFGLGGALVGLAIMAVGLTALRRFAPADLPRIDRLGIDVRGVAFVLALACVLSLGLSIVGSIRGRSKRHVARGRALGGRRGEVRAGLLVTQIAASFVLLVMALLTVESLRQLAKVDPGFERSRVLVARVFPDPAKYATADARIAYFDRLRERIIALPGVRSVGAATGLPMNAYNNVPSTRFGRASVAMEEAGPEAGVFMVTTGYFETMGMRLLEGRRFDDGDTLAGEPVVVVNEALAAMVWPGESAVGKRLRLEVGRNPDTPLRVAGVVASARSEHLKIAPRPEAFRPHDQVPYVTMNVVVRTDLDDPLALADAVRATVLELDPTQPVHSVTTVETLVESALAPDRFSMGLLTALAILALGLTAAGVFGVMAFAVRARWREIGLRMALGATDRQTLGEVLRRGTLLLGFGLAAGWLVSLLVVRVLDRALFGVQSHDPRVALLAATVLTVAVVGACWLPAKRAAGIDPATALRADG